MSDTTSTLSTSFASDDTEFQFIESPEEKSDFTKKYRKAESILISTEHILITLLSPLLLCCKLFGVFPIECQSNGTITHSFFSVMSIYSFIFLASNTTISIVFINFIQYVLFELTQAGSTMDCIAQMVFMGGQCITGISTMVTSQVIANSLCTFWNSLQNVISNFNRQERKAFQGTYIIGRVALICWLTFAVIHASFGIIYFWNYLEIYFDKDENPYFVFYAIIFIIFFVQMSSHLLHSMVLISLSRIIQNCFTVLIKTASSQIKDYKSFLHHYQTFENLQGLCEKFSRMYGFYIIMEMLLTITSTLVNAYFCIYITSNFHRGYSVIIPPSTLVAHAIWLFSICNASERVQKEAGYSMKAMREAAVYNLSPEVNIQIQGLLVALGMKPQYITATRFFKLNRNLITKITAVMTTYLIFLVQFKTDLSNAEETPGTGGDANNSRPTMYRW